MKKLAITLALLALAASTTSALATHRALHAIGGFAVGGQLYQLARWVDAKPWQAFIFSTSATFGASVIVNSLGSVTHWEHVELNMAGSIAAQGIALSFDF